MGVSSFSSCMFPLMLVSLLRLALLQIAALWPRSVLYLHIKKSHHYFSRVIESWSLYCRGNTSAGYDRIPIKSRF
uniref:Uncharacterized protein n=1 Tax=Anguilla anguilla TaxID=7936 RepID=A0A0E9VR25_ANGAN